MQFIEFFLRHSNISMLTRTLVILLGCTLLAYAQQPFDKQSNKDKDGVIVLTTDTWRKAIYGNQQPWFILFYNQTSSDTYRHLRTQWVQLADLVKQHINIGTMDLAQDSTLLAHFKLNQLPAIVMINLGWKHKDLYIKYNGRKYADDMSEWIFGRLVEATPWLVTKIKEKIDWQRYCQKINADFCVFAFLPNPKNSTQEQRDKYILTLKESTYYMRPHSVSYVWTYYAEHPDLEDHFGLQNRSIPQIVLVAPSRRTFSRMPLEQYEFSPVGISNYAIFMKGPFNEGRHQLTAHFRRQMHFGLTKHNPYQQM